MKVIYIWTADKGMNLKEIFALMSTTWAEVKIRSAKIFLLAFFHCEKLFLGGVLFLFLFGQLLAGV